MSRRVLAVLILVATGANARAANLELLWSAPNNCPDAAQIRAQIDALLGRSADDVLTAPLYVAATVKQEGEDQWSLDVLWHRAGGGSSRRIQSDSCVDLARAAALTTALVIDPYGMTSSGKEAASPSESVPRAPSAAAAMPPKGFVSRPIGVVQLVEGKSHRRPDPIEQRSNVFAAGAAEFGSLQGTAIGVALGSEFAMGRLSIRGELGSFLPQSWAKDRYAGRFWLIEALLGPCYSIGGSRFQVSPCLGAVLQSYLARTNGGDGMASSSHWAGLLRGSVGFDMRYRLSASIAMLGSAWIMVGPDRPEFRLHPDIPVFSPKATAFRMTIGAAYDLL